MTQKTEILFPVGRLVMGSLVEPQVKDADGKPLVNKSGPNVGQPRSNYFFAIAIPKGAERAWWETPWGAKIMAAGQAAFPQQFQSPKFAWKVDDGDSTIPNNKGVTPVSREGHAGHWIVRLGSGFAPKTFNANGSVAVEPASIKLGHYVEVLAVVDGNGSAQQPGMFINHSLVAHAGFGPEIYVGPNPEAVGFGAHGLPAGASTTPLGGLPTPDMPVMPAMPGVAMPAMPGAAMPAMPAMPGAAMPAVPGVAPPPPVPVAPHPGILVPRVMLPAAKGMTHEQFLAAGWTDAQMIAQGYLQA
jgi:hypothetical protein